ncbi:unnamed protein product [Heligmosomoides polygyrus]|uniref:CCHC-type domain-containing protein n=1 Tax=Heligmosomoides polygyrus TaxID=6339 RepID=A0A183F721_HELPZ|nr:unnamed protein product [Heligmosomoides polygyrus]
MELLEKYNETFVEHEQLNVIKPLEESKEVEGAIHYLSHQAVLSSHKSTTKLGIVFEASSHYKNCPSLNDALDRGPAPIKVEEVSQGMDPTLRCAFCAELGMHFSESCPDNHGWIRSRKNTGSTQHFAIFRTGSTGSVQGLPNWRKNGIYKYNCKS